MASTLPVVSGARTAELLQRITSARVTVVGDVMLDRYLHGQVTRISPEAPVPVVVVADEWSVPGGAANVAANAAAAGAQVTLIGVVGHDDAGETLAELLRARGLSTDGLMVAPGRPTTSKTRIVAQAQQIVRIDREVANPLAAAVRDQVRAATMAALAESDVLLIEDYDKGAIDPDLAGALIAEARQRKVPVVVDPKLKHFFAYAGATVFKPNRRELDAVFAAQFTGDDADLDLIRSRLGAEHLLLTLGGDGIVLISPGEAPRRSPSLAHEVYDVSGAGDTVAAWTAVALAGGASIAEAAWLANVAAGVEVGKRGTSTVSPAELLEAVTRS